MRFGWWRRFIGFFSPVTLRDKSPEKEKIRNKLELPEWCTKSSQGKRDEAKAHDCMRL